VKKNPYVVECPIPWLTMHPAPNEQKDRIVSETVIQRAKPKRPAVKLTPEEVQNAFQHLSNEFPPILSLDRAAELAGLKPSTLKRKVSEGDFGDSVARRKPLRFWRDRYVQHIFKN
jgi:hypothetical protein